MEYLDSKYICPPLNKISTSNERLFYNKEIGDLPKSHVYRNSSN